jgi:hypothetical protein
LALKQCRSDARPHSCETNGRIYVMSSDTAFQRAFELRDVVETEDAMWVREQLKRIRAFLAEGDADEEMVDTVDYLIEDNERWPESEKELLAGKLQGGEA